MKALIYSAPAHYVVTEVPTPEPRGREVLIRVRACGFCKTDLHIHQGHFFSAFPLIPGHEFAGEVAGVGDGVARVTVGDRVVADNQRQCGVCDACRCGTPLFCEHVSAQGVNAPGGFAEYVLVDESQVYPLADTVTFPEAAMVEPTACAVHGVDVMRPRVGDAALLFGAGPTGLVLAQLLRLQGVSTLVVSDLSSRKLDLAERYAGARTVPAQAEDPGAHMQEIHAQYPQGFDIVIDATGVSSVAEGLPQFVRHGGKIVYYGVCQEDARIRISPYDIFRRELTILGSFSQVDTVGRAARLINSGQVRVKEMITHTLPLEAWGDALRMATDGGDQVKVVLAP